MTNKEVIIILNNLLFNINPDTEVFDIMEDIDKVIEELKKENSEDGE